MELHHAIKAHMHHIQQLLVMCLLQSTSDHHHIISLAHTLSLQLKQNKILTEKNLQIKVSREIKNGKQVEDVFYKHVKGENFRIKIFF